MTLYELLGVQEDATADAIRAAHRKLALQWHPDRNKDARATQVMSVINQAYEILSSPEKRQAYDAKLAAARAPASGMGGVRIVIQGQSFQFHETTNAASTFSGTTFTFF